MHEPQGRADDDVILSVEDLAVHFPLGGGLLGRNRRLLRAVDGVDLKLKRGECLGLVGESGSGKSTVALSILGLLTPTRGRIVLDGQVVTNRQSGDRKALARIVQIVFQDPYASLNPRQTVRRTLEDPLRVHGVTAKSEIEDRLATMMRHVGLRPEQADRYPHEFSGGQRQRIGIARALILNPRIVICDEPVSALDVSIRAQIINLLLELKDTLGLSYIMISHDLGVVEHMSDRVAVMYLGRIVENGDWREIFERPAHPLHAGPDRRHPRSLAPCPAGDHRRRPAEPAQPAERLRLQPALSVCGSVVPERAGAAVGDATRRACGAVLAQRRDCRSDGVSLDRGLMLRSDPRIKLGPSHAPHGTPWEMTGVHLASQPDIRHGHAVRLNRGRHLKVPLISP
ncbi:ABC-type oligopeptide transport system ATPase subunit [Bradyrhizobium yuanmingense]